MNEWIHLNWSTHTHCLRMSWDWETDWLSALPRQEAAGWVAEWGVTTTHGCGGGVGWGGEWMPPLSSSVGPDAPGCQILPVPEFIPPMSPLFNGWTIPLRKFGAGPLSRPQTSRPGRNFTGPFLGQAALNSAIWKHQLWKVILEVWGGGVVPGSYGINPWKSLKGQFQGFLTFWPQNGHLKVQKSLMAPWKVLILCTGTILNPWNGVSDFQVFIL
jgi:hypothetical protein